MGNMLTSRRYGTIGIERWMCREVMRCVTPLTHKVALITLALNVAPDTMVFVFRKNWPAYLDSGSDAHVEDTALIEGNRLSYL